MDPNHAALVSEIAQLSGAIDRQRSLLAGRGSRRSTRPPYPSPRGQRGYARRGAPVGRHRSLVYARDANQGWVRKQTKGSMSLVNPAVYDAAPPSTSAAATTTAAPSAAAAPAKAPIERQVMIDGVPFVFDESGTRLLKKSHVPAPTSDTAAPVTPKQASIDGEAFVRTKSGNLISKALVQERRAARERQARLQRLATLGQQLGRAHREQRAIERAKSRALCTYYTRTGTCRRGDQCPFLHDDTKRALCPGALKSTGCILPPGTCLLSHAPTPENTPHCVHFLRTGTCKHGDACVYIHAPIPPDAPVCASFKQAGWCNQGRACQHRHTKDTASIVADTTTTAPRTEPGPDVLFVRDDSGADDRYFTEGSTAMLDGASVPALAAHDAPTFAQEQDFIELDAPEEDSDVDDDSDDDNVSFATDTTSDTAWDDAEVEASLLPA